MKKMSWMKAVSLVTQLGYTMLTPILICAIIGAFIDEKMKTAPIFTIVLIILGVGGAFRNLFYLSFKQIKKEEKNEQK